MISEKCILEMSTAQKPYFGMRTEMLKSANPYLDDSTILVFRIDSIDKRDNKPYIVGYAYFPLFVDISTGNPAKIHVSDAALQTGNYQIPIFSQPPKFDRPVSSEKLSNSERIP